MSVTRVVADCEWPVGEKLNRGFFPRGVPHRFGIVAKNGSGGSMERSRKYGGGALV